MESKNGDGGPQTFSWAGVINVKAKAMMERRKFSCLFQLEIFDLKGRNKNFALLVAWIVILHD
jgi:hypothetical protein